MGEAFIVRRGGGTLFAAIGVAYPVGSICTCSNSTITLTAGSTSGIWIFSVPSTGTWTVTCTDGTETASENVSITTQGQCKNVSLNYWDGELYDAGEEYIAVTGGWNVVSGEGTLIKNADNMVLSGTLRTGNGIDFTGYSALKCECACTNGYFGVVASPTSTQRIAQAQMSSTSKTTYSIDISSETLQGSFYPYFRANTNATIYKVWLE